MKTGFPLLFVLAVLGASSCRSQYELESRSFDSSRLASKEAYSLAIDAIAREYGPEDAKRHEPYRVSFSNGTWTVVGTVKQPLFFGYTLGGVPTVKIRDSDGAVLLLEHSK